MMLFPALAHQNTLPLQQEVSRNLFQNFSLPLCDQICVEGELVGGVHTLVWRSVQVYHKLQELEEEDKGREEVQEIERESQVEEKRSRGHDYGDDMKRLKHLEPRCVCR